MRKTIGFLLITLATCFLFSIQAFAAEITSIDVEVRLYPDGSAHITEIWTTRAVYEGTQISRVMEMSEAMHIYSLKVMDINGTSFEIVDDWNNFNTFEERANRASLMSTHSGYEIWWGITTHGDNQYVITYTLEGLIEGFTNAAGFKHHFIPRDLSPAPNNVTLLLSAEHFGITKENTEFEIFGVNAHYQFLSDGGLFIERTGDFTARNALLLLTSFDAEWFNPRVVHNHSLDLADFSDPYARINLWIVLMWIAIAMGTLFVTGIILTRLYSRTKLTDGTSIKFPSVKDISLSFEAPFDISLAGLYYLSTIKSPIFTATNAFSAFSAYLLKWNYDGIVDIEKIGKHSTVMLRDHQGTLSAIEENLYNILARYVDQNYQISSGEEDKWEKLGDEINTKWAPRLHLTGQKELQSRGIIGFDQKQKIRFTSIGYQSLVSFWGLVKFLGSGWKEETHLSLNSDHLVLASLLGFEKSLKQYYNEGDGLDTNILFIWQILWLTQDFNQQAYAHYESYQSSIDASGSSGGFSAGGATGGGGGGIS